MCFQARRSQSQGNEHAARFRESFLPVVDIAENDLMNHGQNGIHRNGEEDASEDDPEFLVLGTRLIARLFVRLFFTGLVLQRVLLGPKEAQKDDHQDRKCRRIHGNTLVIVEKADHGQSKEPNAPDTDHVFHGDTEEEWEIAQKGAGHDDGHQPKAVAYRQSQQLSAEIQQDEVYQDKQDNFHDCSPFTRKKLPKNGTRCFFARNKARCLYNIMKLRICQSFHLP